MRKYIKARYIVGALLLLLVLWVLALRNDVYLRLRIVFDPKFTACKENAKHIEGHGYFNVCEERGVSSGIASAWLHQVVVYDSNNVTAKQYCNDFNLTTIIDNNFGRNFAQHVTSIRKLGSHYYKLYYSSDYETLTKCKE